MAFTSYSALKTALLDAIADGSLMTSSYSIHGRTHTFRSLDEALRFIEYCDRQVLAESGDRTSLAQFTRPGDAW